MQRLSPKGWVLAAGGPELGEPLQRSTSFSQVEGAPVSRNPLQARESRAWKARPWKRPGLAGRGCATLRKGPRGRSPRLMRLLLATRDCGEAQRCPSWLPRSRTRRRLARCARGRREAERSQGSWGIEGALAGPDARSPWLTGPSQVGSHCAATRGGRASRDPAQASADPTVRHPRPAAEGPRTRSFAEAGSAPGERGPARTG